jgi:hypothetical protein
VLARNGLVKQPPSRAELLRDSNPALRGFFAHRFYRDGLRVGTRLEQPALASVGVSIAESQVRQPITSLNNLIQRCVTRLTGRARESPPTEPGHP